MGEGKHISWDAIFRKVLQARVVSKLNLGIRPDVGAREPGCGVNEEGRSAMVLLRWRHLRA